MPAEDPPPPTFYDFTQNTTFHGVKYIFEGSTRIRKLLWLLVVLAASGVFIWQVGQRTYDFYRYDTNVDVQLVYAAKMPFPAVTICNQNNFRTSVTVERDLYEFIDEMYSGNNVSAVDLSSYSLHNVDTEEFLRAAAHQVTDFIDSCTWQGQPCNITEDFVTTLTDMGVCYTFNSGTKKPSIQVTEAGSAFGLVLILNVEQYEYMRGPQNDAGIKLMLHQQGEFPLVKEQGFAVAPGSHTLAGIQRTVAHNMQPPYGECNASDTRPLANCLIQCRASFVGERCGCRDIYMGNGTGDDEGVVVCDMERQFRCMKQETVEALRQQSSCNCKQLCEYETYTPSLSYAQLSKFNIDRIVLNDAARRQEVLQKFLLARELSQRRLAEVAVADEKNLRVIDELVKVLWQDVQTMTPVLGTDSTFARYYFFVSILDNGDSLLRQDGFELQNKLVPWERLVSDVKDVKFEFVEKFLQALVGNFLEVGATGIKPPGLFEKSQGCLLDPFLFPLPTDYSDVHLYFRDQSRRKKRSQVGESQASRDFYLSDVPVYRKLQTVNDCGHYLALKQEFAKDLIARHLDLSVDQDHADKNHEIINGFFDAIFFNTSESPTKMPKYQPCMNLLDKMKYSLFGDIDTLVDSLGPFAAADSHVSLTAALETMAQSLAAADLELPNFDATCMWMYDEYFDPRKGHDRLYYEKFLVDIQASYGYFPQVRVSFNNLGNYLKQIRKLMQHDIVPRLSIIDDYLAGNASKLALAETFSALELQRALQTVGQIAADFTSFSREYDQGLKSLTYHMLAAFDAVFNTSFPMINNDMYWNLNVIKHVQRSGLPKYKQILNRFHSGRHIRDITTDLFKALEQDYSAAMEAIKLRLPREIEEMNNAITIMKDELEIYRQETRMNQAFFMENFAQIDIFYSSMSYTEITVHNAFPFISLLSEFGGFMGLLLGASCLTLVEILDHLITRGVAKLRRSQRAGVIGMKEKERGETEKEGRQMGVKTAAWM